MIRVGVIGCGKIAQVRHLPEYHANPNVTITALYDANAERAQACAARYGGRVYATAEALLAADDVDAVSICSTNLTHAPLTILALESGKHVLCEKPMAVTIEDCEAMVAAAKRTGLQLMIGMNQRLAAAHVKAKELLDAGAIGRPVSFRTTFGHGGPETWTVDRQNIWFFDKARASMGVLADLGIHKTDLIQHLLGQRITGVTAMLRTLDKRDAAVRPITVEDNAVCIYEMSGGIVGTMTASWTYYGGEDNSTVIYGTEGELRLCDGGHNVTLRKHGCPDVHYDVEDIQTNDYQTRSGVIDAFIDGLLDKASATMQGEDVICAMRAVFAAVESSETGRHIAIEQNR